MPDTFTVILICIVAILFSIYPAIRIVQRIMYRPGTGKLMYHECSYGTRSSDMVIESSLDDFNIAYSFARVTKIEQTTTTPGVRREYTYTIEYWPKEDKK